MKEPIGGRVVEKEGTALVDFLTIAYRHKKDIPRYDRLSILEGLLMKVLDGTVKSIYVQAAIAMTMINDNE